MNGNDTYLAVFLGSKASPKMKAWNSLPEAERRAKEREGIAAWKAWVEKHQGAIVAMGGPLDKTKKITQRGIEDISNEMGGLHGRPRGIKRGCREAFRKSSAFHNFPRRSRGGHAGPAHPRCVICRSARPVWQNRTIRCEFSFDTFANAIHSIEQQRQDRSAKTGARYSRHRRRRHPRLTEATESGDW